MTTAAEVQRSSAALAAEFDYLERLSQTLALHLGEPCAYERLEDMPVPPRDHSDSALDAFSRAHDPGFEAQTLVLLAPAPHCRPDLSDKVITAAVPRGGDLEESEGPTRRTPAACRTSSPRSAA